MLRFLAILLMIAAPCTAQQAAWDVDLELVLLADATGSIDNDEIMFQRLGYADAITDPLVLDAIVGGIYSRIAVAYVEWGDEFSQDVVVDWVIVDGPDSAAAFAERLMAPPRRAFGRNAIGAALLKGRDMIHSNAHQGLRNVIDLSADTANNWNGPGIADAREVVLADGIVINGLAVLCRYCSGQPISYDLEAAFADRIIGGPGSFVVTADSRETFAGSVRRKLILEIAGSGHGIRTARPSYVRN